MEKYESVFAGSFLTLGTVLLRLGYLDESVACYNESIHFQDSALINKLEVGKIGISFAEFYRNFRPKMEISLVLHRKAIGAVDVEGITALPPISLALKKTAVELVCRWGLDCSAF
ncbi:hypothetical protein [Dyadobacter beijingensis]|uniref:hypothetical protein n=1 Tax=Dyadobacter beijingensis TaxID=365489 RepID=UPI0012FCA90F|nr:hypothetical protein [Dyadobacter beijingensis]